MNRGLIDLDRVERAILLAHDPDRRHRNPPEPVLRRVEPAVLELLYQMDRRPWRRKRRRRGTRLPRTRSPFA